MKRYNKKVGAYGEELARKYLKDKKYKIIYKNFTTPYGEIDIISQLGNQLVFIEVKTRTTNTFGFPEQAINEEKKENFINSVEHYLTEKNTSNKEIRADVISVQINKEKKTVKIWHIKGFF